MKYWLLKSEPSAYSITDLGRDKQTGWSGVRNYQARNFMKVMQPGDQAFFYHSNAEPVGIAGIAEVAKTAYPDPTQFDKKDVHFEPKAKKDAPVWFQVDVKFVKTLPRFIPLDELKSVPALKNMELLKRSRLSVQPVSPAEWEAILKLTGRN